MVNLKAVVDEGRMRKKDNSVNIRVRFIVKFNSKVQFI